MEHHQRHDAHAWHEGNARAATMVDPRILAFVTYDQPSQRGDVVQHTAVVV